MAQYFRANELGRFELFNASYNYEIAQIMFNKGNFKGCAMLCKNCHTASSMQGLDDGQVNMLLIITKLRDLEVSIYQQVKLFQIISNFLTEC